MIVTTTNRKQTCGTVCTWPVSWTRSPPIVCATTSGASGRTDGVVVVDLSGVTFMSCTASGPAEARTGWTRLPAGGPGSRLLAMTGRHALRRPADDERRRAGDC